jgi:hypothetical protein
MISRFFAGTAVTHGLALLLGLCFSALLVKNSGPSRKEESTDINGRAGARTSHRSVGRLSSDEAFRTTYQELSSRSMTSAERRELKEDLFREWGKSDPYGLLVFLKHKRVWPDGFDFWYLMDFAKERPDLLLEFATRNGCSKALESLIYGDLATVARMLEALPQSERSAEILKIEAEVHEKMGHAGIHTSNPTSSYYHGAAEALLDEGSLDEFWNAFDKIEDPNARSTVAMNLGITLSGWKFDDQVADIIERLPIEDRDATAKLMLNHSNENMMFPAVREERRLWFDHLANMGLTEVVANDVYVLFDDDDREIVNREVSTWLAKFPPDDSWKSIEESVLWVWAKYDMGAMADAVEAMPDDARRGRLAVGAVRAMRGRGINDDHLARLMSLITDPEVLKQFEEEDSRPSDPFAD